MIDLPPELPLDAPELVARASQHGVRINSVSARRLRAVTHLDVSETALLEAIDRLHQALAQ
jgi:hypothetical protein